MRAVAAGVGYGVVITARGREDMAPLYAAEVLRVNALLRTIDGWRRIPAEMRRTP